MGIQYIYPNGDRDDASWVNNQGNQTNLYDFINETTGGNYIQGGPGDGTVIFDLQTPAETVGSDNGHVFEVFADKASGASNQSLTMALYQTNTLVATITHVLASAPALYVLNLTSGEAATITSYPDLRFRFTASGNANNTAIIEWARLKLPDDSIDVSGEIATSTWSIVDGSAGVNLYISGAADPITATWSVTTGTVTVTTPLSTWRDVFTIYNPSTDAFHVGQIDMTHNVTAGVGPSSAVDFNHFVYSVGARELYRFKYEETYPSAFIQREGLSSSEVGGPYYDRPDSVIFGFWSYGAWPDLDNPNEALLYEASLPRDLVTTPTTNGYPFYGSGQPAEECFFLIPAQEFDDPFALKTFKRIWLWLIPPPDADDSVSIQVTVYPHPVNAQGNVGASVSRTTSMAGYTPTVEVPQPVKLAYLDFDPQTDPEAGTGSVSGSSFEVRVELATAIGIWRVGVEVEVGGDLKYFDYQP